MTNTAYCFDPAKLYIAPLGGVGEIGKNMMFFQYGEEIIIIDAGFMFPNHEMFGIDFVLPDFNYLVQHKDKIKGIILTHGHEDHVGALPYLLQQIIAPIYGTPLTLGLVKAKLREFQLSSELNLYEINPSQELDLGTFKINFIRNTHSIPDGVGLIIQTPVGIVIHSGDFKFDQTPVDKSMVEFNKLANSSTNQPLLLLSDSTYADRPGYSQPEKIVREALHQIFRASNGRIIITTFASSLPRIKQIIQVATLHKRKVAFIGRSLINNVRIAEELGYLYIPEGIEIRMEDLENYSHKEICIITTGSQGEPMSALSLMATKSHKWVEIIEGDTIIFSATPVPGNEGVVLRNVDLLFRLGANVIYSTSSKADPFAFSHYQVHVPGHAHQEELKLLLNLVQPKFFVPIHGEYRHLVYHARLAQEVGIPQENVFIITNGDIIELTESSLRIAGRIAISNVYVDGTGISEIGRTVLKERFQLAQEGIVVVAACVSKNKGELLDGPYLTSKGFIHQLDAEPLFTLAKEEILHLFKNNVNNNGTLHGAIKEQLNRFFGEKTKRKPVIIPIITEI